MSLFLNILKLPCTRFQYLYDSGLYETLSTPRVPDDPLKFIASKPYIEQLKSARKKTGLISSMVVSTGKINEIQCTAVASDFSFLIASIEQNEEDLFVSQHFMQ